MLKLHLKGRAQTARSAKNREASEAIEQVSSTMGDIKKSLTSTHRLQNKYRRQEIRIGPSCR
jgi:hypothetical protein